MNSNHTSTGPVNPANDLAANGLDRLLATWNSHQELRSSGAPLAQLWQSRAELDEVRLEVRLAA